MSRQFPQVPSGNRRRQRAGVCASQPTDLKGGRPFGLGGLFPSWFRRGPGGGPPSSLVTALAICNSLLRTSDLGLRTLYLVTRHSSLLLRLDGLHDPRRKPLAAPPGKRKVSHGHENVAVIKERTPQPGHAVNLRAMPRRGNGELNRRALASGERSSAAHRHSRNHASRSLSKSLAWR